jgi:hypothetical protein
VKVFAKDDGFFGSVETYIKFKTRPTMKENVF